MKKRLRRLARAALWVGPALVMLLAVLAGFFFWVVASQAGTRWALEVGVRLAGGQVEQVQGTIRDGLSVGELSFKTPTVSVELDDLDMQIEWAVLRDRRLQARNLSVSRLAIDVADAGSAPGNTPFQWPVLPLTILLDRVALNELQLSFDGQPQSVKVADLDASLAVTQGDAQLVLRKLLIGQQDLQADLAGEFKLLSLADPWPFDVQIEARARGAEADSVLCARRFLPELQDHDCVVDLKAQAQGSLDAASVTLDASGQALRLDATVGLAPRQPFPLRKIGAALELPDASTAQVQLDWSTQARQVAPSAAPDITVIQAPAEAPRHSLDQVTASLVFNRLNPGVFAGQALPEAVLSGSALIDATLHDQTLLQHANLAMRVNSGSRWNGYPLSADLSFALRAVEPLAPLDPGYQMDDIQLDFRLAENQIKAGGKLGWNSTQVQWVAKVLRLSDFWPGIDGAAEIDARLQGGVAEHALDLKASYDMGPKAGETLGDAPVILNTRVEGGYLESADRSTTGAWTGRVARLEAAHAAVTVKALQPLPLQVDPAAQAPDAVLQVGATRLEVALPSRTHVLVDHARTLISPGYWSTQGDIDRLVVSKRIVDEVTQLIAAASPGKRVGRGRVIVDADEHNEKVEMSYALDWDFAFSGALAGRARIKHLDGDLIVPGDPPFPLGLKTFQTDIVVTPAGNGNGSGVSRLGIDMKLDTVRMGQATARIQSVLRASPGGGLTVSRSDATTLQLKANVADLAWMGLFVGDDTDIGGTVVADVQATSRPDGTWQTSGTLTGEKIRFVRIDEGVRLVDGTLKAHMESDRLIIDSLSFPAQRRAVPKEWRTEEWTRTNPEAQGGRLDVNGYWDLSEKGGNFVIDMYRYPLMQRADRFAMVTGRVNVGLPSEKVDIKGKLLVDAGWVDLDILSSVPSLDGDVVVVRAKAPPAPPPRVLDLGLDINIDLGPRFYITGYGVDSGLVGQLQVVLSEGKLMGYGGLRTRGGSVEAYGQRLRLRQGTITFQGDIVSPVFNIQALRTGAAVEAGVRVSGTPRRPKIDLVSYPEVSDVEKLSWLLIGRGPDESGGDAALLFSVGSSFLGDGEPFYKKFGLDEVSMRSGELGSVGSILPAESVVRSLDSGTSDIERKFMVAAKNLGTGFKVSLEQSLSETGTVGRLTYRLAQGLSAQLTVGTVNGMALIYRVVVRE